MSLQSRSSLIKRFEFLDRQKSSERHDAVLSDRRMSLGKNEPIPVRHPGLFRVDLHDSEIERHQNIHRRKRSTDMTSSASRNRTDSEPSPFASQHLKLYILFLTTHNYFLLAIFGEVHPILPGNFGRIRRGRTFFMIEHTEKPPPYAGCPELRKWEKEGDTKGISFAFRTYFVS